MQKVYVDSRSRVSGSNTDFEFALPYSITIPEESAMVVDQVLIPNSFYTIEFDVNDVIYILEENFSSGPIWRRAIIPPGYYEVLSLCAGIETAMNTNRTLFSPIHMCVRLPAWPLRYFESFHHSGRAGDYLEPRSLGDSGAWIRLGRLRSEKTARCVQAARHDNRRCGVFWHLQQQAATDHERCAFTAAAYQPVPQIQFDRHASYQPGAQQQHDDSAASGHAGATIVA